MGIKDMFLDIVCEFLFDLILEGAIAGVASRKVPMVIRVLLAGSLRRIDIHHIPYCDKR